jgi:hypothetical protein
VLRDKCRTRYGDDDVPVPVTTRAVAWRAFRALGAMTAALVVAVAVAVEDAMFR